GAGSGCAGSMTPPSAWSGCGTSQGEGDSTALLKTTMIYARSQAAHPERGVAKPDLCRFPTEKGTSAISGIPVVPTMAPKVTCPPDTSPTARGFPCLYRPRDTHYSSRKYLAGV